MGLFFNTIKENYITMKNIYSKFLFYIFNLLFTTIIVSATLTIIIYFSVGRNLGEDTYFSTSDMFFIYTIYSFPLILITISIKNVFIKRIVSLFYSSKYYVLWKIFIYILYTVIISFILLLIFNNENPLNLLNLLKAFLIVGFTTFVNYFLTKLNSWLKNVKNKL